MSDQATSSSDRGEEHVERGFDPERILNDPWYVPTEEEREQFIAWADVEARILDDRILKGIERLDRLAGRR